MTVSCAPVKSRFLAHIRPHLKLKYNHLPRIKVVNHGYQQISLNPYFYPRTTLKLYGPLAAQKDEKETSTFCHISIRMDTRRPCCHLLVGVSDVVIGYTKTNLNEFDILQIRLTNNDSLFTMKQKCVLGEQEFQAKSRNL